MIISLFAQNTFRFGNINDLTVRNMLRGLCFPLQTVLENDLAYDAFKKMIEKNITGLPIVNNKGILIDIISVRDLRGIGTTADKYERLYLPINIYKQRVREGKLYSNLKPIPMINMLKY